MKNIIKKYGHIWILSYGFIYLTWFLHLEKNITTGYHIMHVKLDDLIPFNEYFIVPYLLWFAYVTVAIAYFFFVSREDYYRLCAFLFTGMTISLLICTIFPNGTDFRPVIDPDKNLFSAVVASLYQADTCTNVFPSIHAYNSIAVHISIIKSEHLRKYPAIRIGSGILMVAICLATVFLKQHSIVDVAGSIIMALAIYPLAYAPVSSSGRNGSPEKVYIR